MSGPRNPYRPKPMRYKPQLRRIERPPTIERFNDWCDDLLEAVFCQYFPTLVVVLACLLALLGALGIGAQIWEGI